ncbi:MAG: heavy metal-binding domain-containing protein [Candidatus Gastranaerophilales bacterium]|nr:heavy metal-binding domain-containing protein [Candidatus Gastranaerophilales bacterium]
MDLIIVLTLLVICYFTGKSIERRHYKKIKERELLLIKKPYISFQKNVLNKKEVANSELVASTVVIGCDYFRAFLASLRNIFGGHVSTYESLLDRARREALLRIREKALKINADIVINVKIDSVTLDPIEYSKNPKTCVTAYGTAIRYAK